MQVTRRKVLPLKLAVEYHGVPPMTAEAKAKGKARLAVFAAREKEKRAVEKARNELESYIVNTRSKLNDDEIAEVRACCMSSNCMKCD